MTPVVGCGANGCTRAGGVSICQSLSIIISPKAFQQIDQSGTSGKNKYMAVEIDTPRKFDMRPREFAELFGITEQQACDWRREGIGPDWIRLPGGKAIRYDRTSVDKFIEERRRVPMSHQASAASYDEQTDAALKVLAAVKANVIDNDPEGMLRGLRGSSREVSLRLAEATNLIAHLVKMSPHSEATLAALVETVTNAAGTD